MSETTELTQSDPEVLLRQEISLHAYHLYAARGYVNGLDLQDWLQAEQDVLKQLEPHAQAASATTA